MGRQPASDVYDALPVILSFIPGQSDAGRGHNVPIIDNKMISHRKNNLQTKTDIATKFTVPY